MALTKCSECGREVSDKAAACVGCGAPLSSVSESKATTLAAEPAQVQVTRKGGKWEAIGTVLVVVGVLSVMFATPPISTLGALAVVTGLVVFVVGRFQ